MENSFEEAKVLGDILVSSRLEKNRSQDYMAMCLSVSKNTVSNWERGTSAPNLRQVLKWFRELGTNPFPYMMRYVYPDMFREHNKSINSRELLHSFIDSVPDVVADQLCYVFFGKHGSSPVSIIQMLVAHLHCDMRTRVHVARTIKDSYEMCQLRGELICEDEAGPDMELLEESIMAGKDAAMKREIGYSLHK